MKKTESLFQLALVCDSVLVVMFVGCNQEKVADSVKKAEESAGKAAETVSKDAGKLVDDAGQMAAELGEKAMAYVSPLKEKFGNLESLKEKPEELKKAVTDLISFIEKKAEDVKLPESMSKALAGIKEKISSRSFWLGTLLMLHLLRGAAQQRVSIGR